MLCTGGGSAGAVADAAAPSVASWEARSAPFRLLFRDERRRPTAEQIRERGRGPGSSLGYDLEDGTSHRLTDLIRSSPVPRGRRYIVGTDEPTRTATVIVQRTSRGLRVAWTFQPAAGVARVYESFAARDGEHFLGGGQQGASVDLRGRALELKVSYGCGRTIVAPFYLSSAGYGVLFRTSAIGHLQFAGSHDGPECSEGIRGKTPPCPVAALPDRIQACFKAQALTYEVYAGSPTEVISAYTAAVGRPRLPPPSQFALIKWRDEVASGAELLDDAARLRRAGIPLGWVIVDNPWEENRCLGTLTFDPVRFPDPKRTFAALRERGVKVMLWVSPYLSRREDCPAPGFPDGTLRQGDELEWSIDLTDGRAAAIWRSRLRAALALGVDGLKGDRGDELDHEPDTFAAGPGTLVHNLYPAAFARESFAELRRRGPRHCDDLPCGDSGVDPGAERRVGRRPARDLRRASDGGQDGPDRRCERLPDLGLGHRRVPQRRPHARRLRALGAVRRGDPDLRGGWRRAECPLLDLRARDGRAVPSRRGVAL